MTRIIAQSFWWPLRNFGRIYNTMWPMLLVTLSPSLIVLVLLNFDYAAASEFRQTQNYKIIKLLCLTYVSLLLSSGLVSIHQMIVRGEGAIRIKLLPGRKEIYYAFYLILLTAGAIVLYVFVTLPAGMALHKAQYIQSKEAVLLLTIVLTFPIYAILARRAILGMVIWAVEVEDANYDKKILKKHARSWRWTLSLMLVWMLIAAIFTFFMMVPVVAEGALKSGLELTALFILIILGHFYFWFVFGAFTSIYYRDTVRPDLIAAA